MNTGTFRIRRTLSLSLIVLSACLGRADAVKEDYKGLLLWPYVNEQNVSGLSINLFSGSYERFSGLGIGGFYQGAKHFNGVAIGGLSVIGSESFKGFSIGGIANGGGRFEGLAMGGLAFFVD